jgi:hypothetical protein
MAFENSKGLYFLQNIQSISLPLTHISIPEGCRKESLTQFINKKTTINPNLLTVFKARRLGNSLIVIHVVSDLGNPIELRVPEFR